MTEQNTDALFPHEGQEAIEEEEEKDNSTESSTEETTTEDNPSPGGDEENNQDEDQNKDLPFHEHPRWKQREEEWNKRFNEQEERHRQELNDGISKVREEFSSQHKENEKQRDKMPSWFGGTEEQWADYCDDQEKVIKQAEERAVARFTSVKESEDKAIKEATDFMQSEIAAIESDTTINPKGVKVDPNKLLKIVMDNDLIDSKGRWNYRAGFRILQNETKPEPAKPNLDNRKKIAGATNSESKGEPKPQVFKTSADFKKNRPW